MCLLTEQPLTTPYSLFAFINEIKNTIKQYSSAIWLIAEISEFKIYNNNLFLTLVEYDERGNLLARARGVIWNFPQVLKNFQSATNIELKVGIKILALVTADYHLQYGLTLIIKNLDPSYTLGDAEAKVLKIKQQLLKDGIFNNNKNLNLPDDFRTIAVISPKDAAGLGDFKKDATILQNYNVCHFDYYSAVFQGADASNSITNALTRVLTKMVELSRSYDAIVIIRGGGASSDLTWLNDYAIAKAICLAPIPIFSGIGHHKDQTILDQVTRQSFDTPSKVINFLITKIADHAEQIYNNLVYIKQYCYNFYTQRNNDLTNLFECIKTYTLHKTQQLASVLDEELNLQLLLQQRLMALDKLLDATWQQILCFSPEQTLARGFAIVYSNDVNRTPITSKSMSGNYKRIIIKFHDGEIDGSL